MGRVLLSCPSKPGPLFDTWLVDFSWRCTECGAHVNDVVLSFGTRA